MSKEVSINSSIRHRTHTNGFKLENLPIISQILSFFGIKKMNEFESTKKIFTDVLNKYSNKLTDEKIKEFLEKSQKKVINKIGNKYNKIQTSLNEIIEHYFDKKHDDNKIKDSVKYVYQYLHNKQSIEALFGTDIGETQQQINALQEIICFVLKESAQNVQHETFTCFNKNKNKKLLTGFFKSFINVISSPIDVNGSHDNYNNINSEIKSPESAEIVSNLEIDNVNRSNIEDGEQSEVLPKQSNIAKNATSIQEDELLIIEKLNDIESYLKEYCACESIDYKKYSEKEVMAKIDYMIQHQKDRKKRNLICNDIDKKIRIIKEYEIEITKRFLAIYNECEPKDYENYIEKQVIDKANFLRNHESNKVELNSILKTINKKIHAMRKYKVEKLKTFLNEFCTCETKFHKDYDTKKIQESINYLRSMQDRKAGLTKENTDSICKSVNKKKQLIEEEIKDKIKTVKRYVGKYCICKPEDYDKYNTKKIQRCIAYLKSSHHGEYGISREEIEKICENVNKKNKIIEKYNEELSKNSQSPLEELNTTVSYVDEFFETPSSSFITSLTTLSDASGPITPLVTSWPVTPSSSVTSWPVTPSSSVTSEPITPSSDAEEPIRYSTQLKQTKFIINDENYKTVIPKNLKETKKYINYVMKNTKINHNKFIYGLGLDYIKKYNLLKDTNTFYSINREGKIDYNSHIIENFIERGNALKIKSFIKHSSICKIKSEINKLINSFYKEDKKQKKQYYKLIAEYINLQDIDDREIFHAQIGEKFYGRIYIDEDFKQIAIENYIDSFRYSKIDKKNDKSIEKCISFFREIINLQNHEMKIFENIYKEATIRLLYCVISNNKNEIYNFHNFIRVNKLDYNYIKKELIDYKIEKETKALLEEVYSGNAISILNDINKDEKLIQIKRITNFHNFVRSNKLDFDYIKKLERFSRIDNAIKTLLEDYYKNKK